jgi:hypothetical protein
MSRLAAKTKIRETVQTGVGETVVGEQFRLSSYKRNPSAGKSRTSSDCRSVHGKRHEPGNHVSVCGL